MSIKYNFICHDSVLKQICFANSTYLRESYTGVSCVSNAYCVGMGKTLPWGKRKLLTPLKVFPNLMFYS